MWNFESSFFLLDASPLSDRFANIVSQSIAFFPLLSWTSAEQKVFFNFDEVYFINFSFYGSFGIKSNNSA